VLYVLLFFIGIGLGSEAGHIWKIFKKVNWKIVLVPMAVITGTFAGVALFSLLLPELTLKESLAVGAGFGYYSLSSVIITQISGKALGTVALMSNIFREVATLLMAPFLAKYFGKLATIGSGGATSMDTTLPAVTRFSGKEYGMIAVFSGMTLTLLVPFLVTLILEA
jgi:uncharacterized membrane protein YbjE (DUF340 family)